MHVRQFFDVIAQFPYELLMNIDEIFGNANIELRTKIWFGCNIKQQMLILLVQCIVNQHHAQSLLILTIEKFLIFNAKKIHENS